MCSTALEQRYMSDKVSFYPVYVYSCRNDLTQKSIVQLYFTSQLFTTITTYYALLNSQKYVDSLYSRSIRIYQNNNKLYIFSHYKWIPANGNFVQVQRWDENIRYSKCLQTRNPAKTFCPTVVWRRTVRRPQSAVLGYLNFQTNNRQTPRFTLDISHYIPRLTLRFSPPQFLHFNFPLTDLRCINILWYRL